MPKPDFKNWSDGELSSFLGILDVAYSSDRDMIKEIEDEQKRRKQGAKG